MAGGDGGVGRGPGSAIGRLRRPFGSFAAALRPARPTLRVVPRRTLPSSRQVSAAWQPAALRPDPAEATAPRDGQAPTW